MVKLTRIRNKGITGLYGHLPYPASFHCKKLCTYKAGFSVPVLDFGNWAESIRSHASCSLSYPGPFYSFSLTLFYLEAKSIQFLPDEFRMSAKTIHGNNAKKMSVLSNLRRMNIKSVRKIFHWVMDVSGHLNNKTWKCVSVSQSQSLQPFWQWMGVGIPLPYNPDNWALANLHNCVLPIDCDIWIIRTFCLIRTKF